ncbi:MAG: flagellar biosynthesis protein FlhF [Campylobacterota bacterium]|nr:flagellar biosynthesis protein FlhF [Campylobacterota bacterium]
MKHDIFTASSPDEAYFKAKEKYGFLFKVISARQIPLEGSEDTICEILVSVSESLYNEKNQVQLATTQEREEDRIVKRVSELFIKRGVAQGWLESVLDGINEEAIKQDREKLTSYLLSSIFNSINEAKESLEEKKIIMLVGPTGVGKTTNIAKLASRYSRDFDKKVALLNLDRYKTGAREQLALHADSMSLKHIAVDTIDDFASSLFQLEDFDLILVDTAGISPFDIDRMISNVEYILASHKYKVSTTLALSALSKEEDIEDIYQNFSFLDLDSILFTKFDETRHIGNVINFLLKHNQTPLSYISIGQNVPEDILSESKKYILDKFVGTLT